MHAARRSFQLCALLLPLGASGCSDDAAKGPPPSRASTGARPAKKLFPELPCKAGEPRTERDGKVLACIIGSSTKVGPFTCAAGALAALYEDGKLKECTLARAHAYNGVPCRAGGAAKWFKSGKLYQCSVDKPFAASGVTCRDRLIFHENGKLHRCTLAESVEVGKVQIPAKSEASFDDTGKPATVKRPADAPLEFQAFKCSEVTYYRSGAVETCIAAAKATVADSEAAPGSRICFDEQGKPDSTVEPACFGREPATKPK
ncbi:MAG: hypothetical protein JRI23_22930 [Deltaproteobacteria bacterium]|jgi:hypothetical protein|nr:hypothetical protein [Deltaproteobacteria bacterium]MBW2534824.1 hypothetical protein [Deltaproteobacteria bacterium]